MGDDHSKVPLMVKLSVPFKQHLKTTAKQHNMTVSEYVRKVLAKDSHYNLSRDNYRFGPKD